MAKFLKECGVFALGIGIIVVAAIGLLYLLVAALNQTWFNPF